MSQEVNENYSKILDTSVPYWDENCGEYYQMNLKIVSIHFFKI